MLARRFGKKMKHDFIGCIDIRIGKEDSIGGDEISSTPRQEEAGFGCPWRSTRFGLGIGQSRGIRDRFVVDDETIAYATRLTDSKPKARRAPRASESRLFLTWSRGDLVAADRVLLANADIDAADKVVLHFLPEATRKRLETLEKEFQKRPVTKIRRTVFGLRDTFRGYEVYVKRQQERP